MGCLGISVNQFKQIRAAFHPKVGASSVRDKCHQLRFAISALNAASKATFSPELNLSFDKDGVASRSHMNPVRQYNKDKPKQFRVNFVVLVNNAPNNYFIIYVNVYQIWKTLSLVFLKRSRACHPCRRLLQMQ